MSLTVNAHVGTLATEHPASTRVFARHGIDFCCGGGRPLVDVCTEKGIDAVTVLREIQEETVQRTFDPTRWDRAPLDGLIEHILLHYHRPLEEELPRLEAMAARVLKVHRDKDPERLAELSVLVRDLGAELEQHMAKEEQILFPMILAGKGGMAGPPIEVMHQEHDEAGAALRRLRELTDDYRVPAEACNTWRALWHGLEELETALHEHIHLENNVLFPRAQEGIGPRL